MNWQKRARIGVAIFGLVSAIAVYAAMGERTKPIPVVPPTRVDPKALIESQGTVLQQVQGTRQDYVVEAAQQLVYEGGATQLRDVKVTINNRAGGKSFIITAKEAQATEKQQNLQLAGDVKLAASDGFQLATSKAQFTEKDGTVHAPDPFTFSRGRMTGAGTGMVYDKNSDILSIAQHTDVRLTDEGGNTLTQFTAGATVFTRPMHRLDLSGAVHVLHNGQLIDAESATAYLTDDDSLVKSILLKGKSQVTGGTSGLELMRADDMDLTYAEDGATLDHVVMRGNGQVKVSGSEGAAGREIAGNLLDILLAPDGSISRVAGRNGVRLDLDGGPDAPARRVTAQWLDGTGESGQGLTAAQFRDNVEYREEASGGRAARVARSQRLQIGLAGNAVQSAVFTGRVTFSEQVLQASGGEATYAPGNGTLRLVGGAERNAPRVADDQVSVEAEAIDVTLESRAMNASGGVRTTLKPRPADNGPAGAARSGAPAASAGSEEQRKLPGLLKQEQPVNVGAMTFAYGGAAGTAVYTGNAALLQGDTAIRADEITIDQGKGNLAAIGNARSTFALDTGTFVGNSHAITYLDADRTVTYTAPMPAPPAPGSAPRAAAATTPPVVTMPARLSGPQGDLRAERIQIVLAAAGGKAERLEAYNAVDLNVDKRKATGARLTYFSADDRYLMTGTATAPVKVVDNCRQTIGKTLIFFKTVDRMIVDGNEEIRTQTTNGGTCAQSPSPPSR
jgi:LPS export ABC transporter protein LptC